MPIEDFDTRPVELRGKSNEHLKTLLGKVRGHIPSFWMKSVDAGRLQQNIRLTQCCL